MGAHADWYPEEPLNCACERTHYDGTPGWFITRIRENCPTHGKPENLGPDATRRQREISERKWA